MKLLHVRAQFSPVTAALTSAIKGRWKGWGLYVILLCGVIVYGVQTETWLSGGQRWRGKEWCTLGTVYTCGDLRQRDVWSASDSLAWSVSSLTIFLRFDEFHYCFGSSPMPAPVLEKKVHSKEKTNRPRSTVYSVLISLDSTDGLTF